LKFSDSKRPRRKSYTIINNYRFVRSSQSSNTYYLKCAHFRRSCKARAIIRKDTMEVKLKDGNHTCQQNPRRIYVKREI
ncbi:pre-mod(mdg4)-AE, partial [Musca autumnalis]|uniref:pre-mod(mdg4)-AE n=1 Tax=Musca autumnalis TaxID=221902 RepID=UPI003CF37FF0